MNALAEPILLNRKQLACALGVSLRTVDTMLALRQIPQLRIGKKIVRFDLGKVREALTAFEQPATGGRA